MALTPGTRLGVYEVTAPIGEGGMGQVYRATDTTLGRQVAIKILPDAFASDPERLARFEREAKTLASLNHRHIAAIYAVEKSAGLHALVMELVEGVDLSLRIAGGRIPLDEALPIATQIADALEAAHEQGIVHRDLKPANIRVRSDGTVKVLDFGLAKAMEPAAGSSPSSAMSPTITTPAMTQAGMILGTAAYMAPEQVRGKIVDKRADIWAFGCVLYEMLTGQRVFKGEETSDVLAAVLRQDVDWTALPAAAQPRLHQLLARCLDRDPRTRLRDIGEARVEIDTIIGGAGDGAVASPATASAAASPASGRPAWVAALAVAAVVIIALAVPAMRYLREAPPSSPPETRTEIVTPATDSPAAFALSPDGRQIVFVASGDGAPRLWVRSLATTTAQPLAGTEGAQFPFWSPDSRSVGFFAEGKLKRFDLGGSAPQTVATAGSARGGARGGTWNADGVILFNPSNAGPLLRVPASGGQPVAVTKVRERQTSHRFPSFLPDGRHFLFYAQGTPDTAGIYLGALDAPDTHRVTAADAAGAAVYLSPGWLLWVRARTLVAQRLDLDRQALAGEPVTLADPVVVDTTFNVAALSASAGGLIAYRTGGATRRQLTWVDRSGTALGPMGAPDENGLLDPTLSSDGHRVAVSRSVQGNFDIWLLDGTRMSRFTFDAGPDRAPFWSPDGSRIVFSSVRKEHRDLYQGSSSRAGEGLLLASPQDKFPTDWSADGRFLLYMSRDPQTGSDFWVLPMEGDRTPWVFLKTPFSETAGTFSPDGRWVAYMSNESGREEIYVRPFAGTAASGAALRRRSGQAANAAGGQWQVSTAGGIVPRWRRDGKELYYLNPAGAMMAAPITVTGSTLAPGTPMALFPTRIVGGGSAEGPGRQYDVAPDGRFLINTVLDEASAPITLLQNWHPEAKK